MHLTFARIGQALCLSLLACGSAQAQQQTPDGWRCRYCPEPQTAPVATLELGLGHVDGPLRYAAGSTAGPVRADGAGALLWLGGQWSRRDTGGHSFGLRGDRIGLDNPWLEAFSEQPGSYALNLSYQELLHRPLNPGRTPFSALGGGMLRLPDDWVRGSSTRSMDTLASSLHRYSREQQRRWLDLAGNFTPRQRWSTQFRYHHEQREGLRRSGASLLTQAVLLPQIVDHRTDRIDLSAKYQADDWLTELGYQLSLFRNERSGLSWQNPYTALAAGAEQGELALAPDNQAHQLSVSGLYFGAERWTLSGMLAAGRQEQDAELLDVSANSLLAESVALPRRSARARADLLNGQLRAAYRVRPDLRLQFRYRLHDRDNRTPRELFTQVRTDVFIAENRVNRGYSFRNQSLELKADYRPLRHAKVQLGVAHERRERDLQTRRRTDEDRVFARLRLHSMGPMQLNFAIGHAERDGSAFEPSDSGAAPDNPHQRVFNLANRTRRDARLNLSLATPGTLQFALQGQIADERYDDSSVGLQSNRHAELSASLSGTVSEDWYWHTRLNQGSARLRQNGSQQLALADWWASSHDTYQGAGFGLEKAGIIPKVDLTLDYEYSRADGEIAVSSDAFPQLKTRLHSLHLAGVWHWRPNLDWQLDYRYERYFDADWQDDGLAVDTLDNLLADGVVSPNAVTHLITLLARYRF